MSRLVIEPYKKGKRIVSEVEDDKKYLYVGWDLETTTTKYRVKTHAMEVYLASFYLYGD